MKDEPFLLKVFHECSKEEQMKICKQLGEALEKDKIASAVNMLIFVRLMINAVNNVIAMF